ESQGALFLHGGLLLAKERDGRALMALDRAPGRLVWSRPVGENATLVEVADDTAYLLDNELSAISLTDQPLRWAALIPGMADGMNAVVADDRVLVFTGRGVFEISKATGDTLRIFRGDNLENTGGRILIDDN